MSGEKQVQVALGAVLLSAALLGGCSSKANDTQLVTNIQSQMFSDAQLKNSNLQVASIDGQVTLKGNVPNDAARYEAYKIAAQTAGVGKVIDQMQVADSGVAASAHDQGSAAAPAAAPSAALAPAPARLTASHPQKKPKPRPEHITPASHTEVAQSTPPQAVQPEPTQDEQAAPSPAPQAAVTAPAPAVAVVPAPQPKQFEVPAGTTVSVRMIDAVDSSVNQAGEMFHASLDAPIVVGNDVIVTKGADVYLRLASASSAGKLSGQSELRLELVKLVYQGKSYPLVSSTYSETGKSRGKDTATKVGAGAVLGAIIGGIAGGGKGAAVGATVGGGGGAVYQGATHGQQVKIPSETKLDFQLDQPATVSVVPPASANTLN